MKRKVDLLLAKGLRGFQMLLGIVVLGLSATLIKGHYDSHPSDSQSSSLLPGAPFILPLSAATGAITFAAAIFNLAITWTDFLQNYIAMLVDVGIIVANVTTGTIIAIKLQGKNCGADTSNFFNGSPHCPSANTLGGIDILNGGCVMYEDQCYCAITGSLLSTRCKKSQSDSVFMFIIVVLAFATFTLTYLRMKKNT